METRRRNRAAWPLALLVAYALACAGWGLARTPLGPREARDILAGRDVLSGGAPACPPGEVAPGSLPAATCGWPEAAALGPAAAAWAERGGGLAGARVA